MPEQAGSWNLGAVRATRELSGAPTGTFDSDAQHGFGKSLVWTTEAIEAAIAEMAERLVEIPDGKIDVSEALEILARGIGRWGSRVHGTGS